MAFEGILDLDRGAGYTKPSRFRRIMLTISLGVHAAALIAGVAWSFWQVEELAMPQVAVTLTATAPPPPPPPPPASHHSSTKPKTKPVRKVETLVQPQEHPKEQPKPKEEEDEPDQAGGVEGGVKGGVQGGVVGGVVGAAVTDAPKMLAQNVARQLLLIDPAEERYRVKLPEALSRSNAVVKVLVKVCVSAEGAVTEARVLKGAGPAIDPQIPVVLKTWRYKPYTIDGKPTPFCFPLLYQISER